MSSDTTDPASNLLLGALPVRELRRLTRSLTTVPLEPRQVLSEPGRPIEHVYFPGRGAVIALFSDLADGRSFATGYVGHEGMAGMEVLLGGGVGHYRATVLAGGEAVRFRAGTFQTHLRAGGSLPGLLRRYVQFFLFHVTQVSGCHCFHSLEQHFCSLLLRLRDGSCRDELEITHELFARMIGVRRVGITQVARKLRHAGLIRYRWGKVTILDPAGLSGSACECHRQIRQACHLLLAPDGSGR